MLGNVVVVDDVLWWRPTGTGVRRLEEHSRKNAVECCGRLLTRGGNLTRPSRPERLPCSRSAEHAPRAAPSTLTHCARRKERVGDYRSRCSRRGSISVATSLASRNDAERHPEAGHPGCWRFRACSPRANAPFELASRRTPDGLEKTVNSHPNGNAACSCSGLRMPSTLTAHSRRPNVMLAPRTLSRSTWRRCP